VVFFGHRLGSAFAEAHARPAEHAASTGDALLEPAPVEIATTSAGTFMGMKDELLLEHIRTQPVVEAKLNRGGSSISFRLTFADGTRAAFKPVQTNPQTVPRKEVAACSG
jgi:hypothetical protein